VARMLILLLFAFIAGAGTAITPCVLPVLPALLSASAAGGRRRPLGIVVGLAVTFTVAIVALAQLVQGIGLAAGAARTLAIVVLIGFGLILLVPELAERVQAPLSRLARFGPRTRGTGFWSGLTVGAALGFVCAPCAGPILAAVTSVSASTGPTARVVAVALAYALGLSAVMLVYALGGRALLDRIRRHARGYAVERTLGVILLVTGIAMAANLDVRFEEALARDTSLPAIFVDPTRSLENSSGVQHRLASLRPASRFAQRQKQQTATPVAERVGVAIPGVRTPALGDLGPAPPFTDTEQWFNTPGGRPLTLASMRGHVVLVDFWTYTCINCLRTLPFVKGLYAHYHRYGLDVVGVETPEFTFEQVASNVRQAIASDGIRYPVVQDNRYGTWNAYQNQYWPAEYFIDAQGRVRLADFGEGDYGAKERAIRSLLLEAGASGLGGSTQVHALQPAQQEITPESYLGVERGERFTNGTLTAGEHEFGPLPGGPPPLSYLRYAGSWDVGGWAATAGSGARLQLHFLARRVYLVAGSPAQPGTLRVLLDGQPIPRADSGADVHAASVNVGADRLYKIVELPSVQEHTLTIEAAPGVSVYDFTFG